MKFRFLMMIGLLMGGLAFSGEGQDHGHLDKASAKTLKQVPRPIPASLRDAFLFRDHQRHDGC